jgi:hypothetical protein
METGHDIMPNYRSERPTAKKQLYGFSNGRKQKRRFLTSSSSSTSSRPAAKRRDSFGFFSMLRGDGDRSRRPSAFVEDGVMKTLQMVSYLETPAAFGLSMEERDEDKKDEDSEGVRQEEEDGLGSSTGNDWTSRNRKMSIGNSVVRRPLLSPLLENVDTDPGLTSSPYAVDRNEGSTSSSQPKRPLSQRLAIRSARSLSHPAEASPLPLIQFLKPRSPICLDE